MTTPQIPHRFEVSVEGQKSPIAEIGVGEPIGETGFFSGATRNARTASRSESWRLRNVITGRRYTARLTRDRRGGGLFQAGAGWGLP